MSGGFHPPPEMIEGYSSARMTLRQMSGDLLLRSDMNGANRLLQPDATMTVGTSLLQRSEMNGTKLNVGCKLLRSEMTSGNHSAPYDAKINVGRLLLRSEMNYCNIQLRMTLISNVGCLTFTFGNELR